MRIRGIAKQIVSEVVQRSNELGQGRNVGCIGFVDESGIVSAVAPMVDGGLGGIPLRTLLGTVTSIKDNSLIEGLQQLPENAVFIISRPGKTGLNTDISGVDFFGLPIVSIGVKAGDPAGIGLVHPKPELFNLATESERLNLETLATATMDAEREVLRLSHQLELKYLEVSEDLPAVDLPAQTNVHHAPGEKSWSLPRCQVNSIEKSLAELIVNESVSVGQGREVAVMGRVDDSGRIRGWGRTVAGGIGFVPSRLLASSGVDVEGRSLREIYSDLVPPDAVIVHTHPGGTGVMHIGDASAGPGSWGRPIVAIGHDREGVIRGGTVIETSNVLFNLNDEEERLNLQFFLAKSPEQESEIRNRKFGIAQEFTDLCKPIEIN